MFIVISGPPNGGKSTLANKMDGARYECSGILNQMVTLLGMPPTRESKIAVGAALRTMDDNTLIDATLRTIDPSPRVIILSGIADAEELNVCREWASAHGRKMIHIYQSMYATKEHQRTSVGMTYKGDCRINMMHLADMWNPQDELVKGLMHLADMWNLQDE